jgi:hypothetical protein
MASLLNALAGMGGAVSDYAAHYGAQAQANEGAMNLLQARSALEAEAARQADAMLSARETRGRTETFGYSTQLETQRAAAQAAAAKIAADNARQLKVMELNAPPETARMLHFLYPDQFPLPGAGPTPSSGTTSPAPAPAAPGGGSGDQSGSVDQGAWDTGTGPAPPPVATTTDAAASPTPPTTTAAASSPSTAADDTRDAVIRKATGQPAKGSEAEIRTMLAKKIDTDARTKDMSPGEKAGELETQLAVVQGKMTDPKSRESMAQAIANYQLAPLTNFALTKAGGPETMARALEINPDYQESRYPEVAKAMTAFGTGPEGKIIRSLNVAVQHLETLDQAAAALQNGNIGVLNRMGNAFAQQFGSSAPTTFDGLRQVVVTEVMKAVAGNIGSEGDRDRLIAALNRANSPAQLLAITAGFRSLMAGQLRGLKDQYEDATPFKSGPFAFENKLSPATRAALASPEATPLPEAPPPANRTPAEMYGGVKGATAPAPAPTPPPRVEPPPLAPADPADRVAGKAYTAPGGRVGIWRATGWEPVN